jgi:hypothetical protein
MVDGASIVDLSYSFGIVVSCLVILEPSSVVDRSLRPFVIAGSVSLNCCLIRML